jgi:hypothetical protein
MANSLENQDVAIPLAFCQENIYNFAIACGDLPLSVADHARLMKFGMVFVRTDSKYTRYKYRGKRDDFWGDGKEWISFYSRSHDDSGIIIDHAILDTGELVGGTRSLNHRPFTASVNPPWGWPAVHEDYQGETWVF